MAVFQKVDRSCVASQIVSSVCLTVSLTLGKAKYSNSYTPMCIINIRHKLE